MDQLPLFDPNKPPTPPKAAALTAASPVESVFQSWIAYLRSQDRSPHTIVAFSQDVGLLITYLEEAPTIGSLTTNRLNQFLHWMRHERGVPCSDKTYGRRVTSLKAFFRWATPACGLSVDPAEAVLQLSVRSPLPEIINAEEIERCLNAGEILRHAEKPDLRPLLIFKLLLETGMKKIEVANLKLEHIHTTDEMLEVRYPKKKDWAKERKLKISREWLDLFSEYRAEYAPKEIVFPWTTRTLEFFLTDLSKAAGLEKNVSFDMMRWVAAVRDFADGMEEEALRRKLGLSAIQWRETGARVKKLART